ncbi:FAD-dependent oxidoreductase [Halomonas marinisediminis]|uniref:FAD-dependent oxidoreductase n=1 Tax=Halomonas marinisediminis TaxID=2546095 RepID=A0ABY2DAI9_9GAMM|nr:FAD-dependent oxidoreductase [Halomonas marinisediminis]TDB04802.1 FAD-dependent oxidoreductase [Halomonas marinisediminis]
MRPYWIKKALDEEEILECPPLENDIEADVCIVGGGYTGLWTAIMIKEQSPDVDVVVVEADVCGAGASGRNGGCALTWSAKYFTLEKLFGEEEAVRLVKESEESIYSIGKFCEKYEIDADFLLDGTLYTATNSSQLGANDSVISALESQGVNSFRKLSLSDVKKMSGSDKNIEAWYSPVAATVQPGKLVRGMRKVAIELGVKIFESTPMLKLEEGVPATVVTPSGNVRAEKIVLGINAWMARSFPRFERTIAIVSSDMIITESCPEVLEKIGLTSGVSVLDSRTFVHYYHRTPDGRIMLGKGGNTFSYGGKVSPVFDKPSPYRNYLHKSLVSFFPELSGVEIEASWNGASDRSVTGLPFFGKLNNSSNIFYGFGYSGNGVGPCHMGGQILSSLVLGLDNDWVKSPLARGPLGYFPPEPFRYFGSLMVRNAIRRKEYAEDVERKPKFYDIRLSKLAAAAGKSDKS